MPKGRGTYGKKRGRPGKKTKQMGGAHKGQFTKYGAKKRSV